MSMPIISSCTKFSSPIIVPAIRIPCCPALFSQHALAVLASKYRGELPQTYLPPLLNLLLLNLAGPAWHLPYPRRLYPEPPDPKMPECPGLVLLANHYARNNRIPG